MELGPELIIELKKKHGTIFQVDLGKLVVIFRALTVKEFSDLSIEEDYTSSADSEEAIVKTALLFPEFEKLEALGAGSISGLAAEIVEESSFFNAGKSKDILDEQRERMSDLTNLMKVFIISAMPVYSLEELDELTFAELAYKTAIAEEVFKVRFGLERAILSDGGEPPELLLIDPEEEAAEMKRRSMQHNLSKPDGTATAEDPIAQKLFQAFQ